MSDREFSDIQIFQRSGKGIPLFMTGHKNCLEADYLLGPGPRLIKKKNLPGRGLTKVEKHWFRSTYHVTVTHILLHYCKKYYVKIVYTDIQRRKLLK
jgi:hypothetical protein